MYTIPISFSGSYTETTQSKTETIYSYSESDFSLDDYGEVRIRFEKSNAYMAVSGSGEYAYCQIGLGPNYTAAISYNCTFLAQYRSGVFSSVCAPSPALQRQGFLSASDSIQKYWSHFDRNGTVVASDQSVAFKIFFTFYKRATSTKVSSYSVKGTLYIEGRK